MGMLFEIQVMAYAIGKLLLGMTSLLIVVVGIISIIEVFTRNSNK